MLEGRVYGRYIVKSFPTLKLGVLYQDDAYGRDLVAGLKKGLGAKAKQIVSLVGYDPTAASVASQVAQIKASKATAYLIFAFGKFAVQASIEAAKLGWKPKLVVVNAVASSANLMGLGDLAGGKPINKGAVSIACSRIRPTPSGPRIPGLALARKILKKYIPNANPKDGYYIAGIATAMSLVDVLRRAGRNLTRASVMKAARSQNQVEASARRSRHRDQDLADGWLSYGAGGAPALGERQGVRGRPLVDVRPAPHRPRVARTTSVRIDARPYSSRGGIPMTKFLPGRTARNTSIAALCAVLATIAVANGAARTNAGPTLVSEPSISGAAVVGGELIGHRGLWSGTKDVKYAYQWLQCKAEPAGDSSSATCKKISGATSQTYTVRL